MSAGKAEKKKQIASPDWPKVKGKSPSKLPVWDIKKCVESSSNLERGFWMDVTSEELAPRSSVGYVCDFFCWSRSFSQRSIFWLQNLIGPRWVDWRYVPTILVLRCTPPKTGKSPFINMRYIFKWLCFHCHVRFRWCYSCPTFVYQRGKRYLFRHYDISPRLKMGLRPARMAHQNLIGPHWKPRNARNKGITSAFRRAY